jgi:ABC-type dipeptide/oligopeptide/nickel transport system permease component
VSNNGASTQKNELVKNARRSAIYAGGLGGCSSLLIVGLAIPLGLWLDKVFAVDNHLVTFGLILFSVPVNIVVLLWVVRKTSARYDPAAIQKRTPNDSLQEDDNSVGS